MAVANQHHRSNCHPKTNAVIRNMARQNDAGWEQRARPVEMKPETEHGEYQ